MFYEEVIHVFWSGDTTSESQCSSRMATAEVKDLCAAAADICVSAHSTKVSRIWYGNNS